MTKNEEHALDQLEALWSDLIDCLIESYKTQYASYVNPLDLSEEDADRAYTRATANIQMCRIMLNRVKAIYNPLAENVEDDNHTFEPITGPMKELYDYCQRIAQESFEKMYHSLPAD